MTDTLYTSNNETLWDVALNAYGSIEGIFAVIEGNGIDSIDHVPDVGKTMVYDSALVFKNKFENREVKQEPAPLYDIIVQHDQSIWDLTIQEYGAIDQVFQIITDNAALSGLSTPLLVGDKLICKTDFEGDYAAMQFFRGKRSVVTGGTQTQSGLGYLRIGANFKVS